MELSRAEMELFKADMEASKAEASVGKVEGAVARVWIIASMALFFLGVAALAIAAVSIKRKHF
jgi:hypothetical protein